MKLTTAEVIFKGEISSGPTSTKTHTNINELEYWNENDVYRMREGVMVSSPV